MDSYDVHGGCTADDELEVVVVAAVMVQGVVVI